MCRTWFSARQGKSGDADFRDFRVFPGILNGCAQTVEAILVLSSRPSLERAPLLAAASIIFYLRIS